MNIHEVLGNLSCLGLEVKRKEHYNWNPISPQVKSSSTDNSQKVRPVLCSNLHENFLINSKSLERELYHLRACVHSRRQTDKIPFGIAKYITD